MKFPGEYGSFPGKDKAADYLEHYSNEFKLPVQLNTRVNHFRHYKILNNEIALNK